MINIDELNRIREEKIERKKNTYETILKKCHNRIKIVANSHNNLGCCFFQVPKYIYGLPLYDSYSCIMYLVTSLLNNGFDVQYTHPNLLYISWVGKSNPKTIEHSSKPKKDYREINDYKPTNSLIYNNNSLNSLMRKSNSLFK